jgi:hypothetical protein
MVPPDYHWEKVQRILEGDDMTEKKIVQALRRCQFGAPCARCQTVSDQNCVSVMQKCAADLIERMTADVADLRKEIEWKDMVIAIAQRTQAEAEAERDALLEQIKARRSCLDCKHFDYCEFDDATVIDCMSCVTKNCPCHQCSNSSRWEWHGLQGAPEEGDT